MEKHTQEQYYGEQQPSSYTEPQPLEEYAEKQAEEYKEAKKRVKEIKGFYGHLSSYVLVNGFLFILNMITSPGNWWFYWPMLGWGFGLASHWFSTFGVKGIWGKKWEDRKIEKIMEENRSKKQYEEF